MTQTKEKHGEFEFLIEEHDERKSDEHESTIFDMIAEQSDYTERTESQRAKLNQKSTRVQFKAAFIGDEQVKEEN